MFKLPPNLKDEIELERDEVREPRPRDVGASISALIGYGFTPDVNTDVSSAAASADFGRSGQAKGSSAVSGSLLTSSGEES